MTDRDHFAAAALTGWLASQQTVISQAEMAQRAYRYADAMLRERGQENHDAAPAARAEDVLKEPTGLFGGEPAGEPEGTVRTGDTQNDAVPAADCEGTRNKEGSRVRASATPTGNTEEPAAFAVMSGSRSYDVYDTQGEAEAICRWLCEEESGDIWRVVPLVPADATPPLHATSDECSVHPEGTQPDRTLPVCPYVVGKTTRYCSLTTFTLTDEEREAVRWAAETIPAMAHKAAAIAHCHAETLRKLDERLG
jgi:hypothetical protein